MKRKWFIWKDFHHRHFDRCRTTSVRSIRFTFFFYYRMKKHKDRRKIVNSRRDSIYFQRTDFLIDKKSFLGSDIFSFWSLFLSQIVDHLTELDDEFDWTDIWLWKIGAAALAPIWLTPRTGDDEVDGHEFESDWRKLKQRIVSSWELETIWNSSNWRRKTRPVCSFNVWRHNDVVGERGSRAAGRSHILIFPS